MLTVVTWKEAGPLGKTKNHTAHLLGGPEIEHYDQAVAIVVADTFEHARAAAKLIRRSTTSVSLATSTCQQVGRAPPKGASSGEGQRQPARRPGGRL